MSKVVMVLSPMAIAEEFLLQSTCACRMLSRHCFVFRTSFQDTTWAMRPSWKPHGSASSCARARRRGQFAVVEFIQCMQSRPKQPWSYSRTLECGILPIGRRNRRCFVVPSLLSAGRSALPDCRCCSCCSCCSCCTEEAENRAAWTLEQMTDEECHMLMQARLYFLKLSSALKTVSSFASWCHREWVGSPFRVGCHLLYLPYQSANDLVCARSVERDKTSF